MFVVGSIVGGCKNENNESAKDMQQSATGRPVLANNWKEILNQGIIQDNEIQKIVFLDLSEENKSFMDNALDTVYHPKNEEESSQDFGDVYMWGLFGNCSNLETVDVGNFDTSNVTNMSGMFGGCEKLEKIDVTGFDTSKVTDMTYMFMNCSSMSTVDLSGFDFSSIGEKVWNICLWIV